MISQRQSTRTLLPEAYDELRRIAAIHLRREPQSPTLQPTLLVHEVFLKLAKQDKSRWDGKAHFCAVASSAIRRILLDHARSKNRIKRGGKCRRVTLSDAAALSPNGHGLDAIDLEEGLSRLAELDPVGARLAELRLYGGLTMAETAEAMDLSVDKARKEWTHARAWLQRFLGRGG